MHEIDPAGWGSVRWTQSITRGSTKRPRSRMPPMNRKTIAKIAIPCPWPVACGPNSARITANKPQPTRSSTRVADMIVRPISLLNSPMSMRILAITGLADSDRIDPMKSAVENWSFGVTPITWGKT